MTIWRMRIAGWITKATDTHSEYVTPIAFPLQPLHERVSMLHCLSFSVPPSTHKEGKRTNGTRKIKLLCSGKVL